MNDVRTVGQSLSPVSTPPSPSAPVGGQSSGLIQECSPQAQLHLMNLLAARNRKVMPGRYPETKASRATGSPQHAIRSADMIEQERQYLFAEESRLRCELELAAVAAVLSTSCSSSVGVSLDRPASKLTAGSSSSPQYDETLSKNDGTVLGLLCTTVTQLASLCQKIFQTASEEAKISHQLLDQLLSLSASHSVSTTPVHHRSPQETGIAPLLYGERDRHQPSSSSSLVLERNLFPSSIASAERLQQQQFAGSATLVFPSSPPPSSAAKQLHDASSSVPYRLDALYQWLQKFTRQFETFQLHIEANHLNLEDERDQSKQVVEALEEQLKELQQRVEWSDREREKQTEALQHTLDECAYWEESYSRVDRKAVAACSMLSEHFKLDSFERRRSSERSQSLPRDNGGRSVSSTGSSSGGGPLRTEDAFPEYVVECCHAFLREEGMHESTILALQETQERLNWTQCALCETRQQLHEVQQVLRLAVDQCLSSVEQELQSLSDSATGGSPNRQPNDDDNGADGEADVESLRVENEYLWELLMCQTNQHINKETLASGSCLSIGVQTTPGGEECDNGHSTGDAASVVSYTDDNWTVDARTNALKFCRTEELSATVDEKDPLFVSFLVQHAPRDYSEVIAAVGNSVAASSVSSPVSRHASGVFPSASSPRSMRSATLFQLAVDLRRRTVSLRATQSTSRTTRKASPSSSSKFWNIHNMVTIDRVTNTESDLYILVSSGVRDANTATPTSSTLPGRDASLNVDKRPHKKSNPLEDTLTDVPSEEKGDLFEGELCLRFQSTAEREKCYTLFCLAHPEVPVYDALAAQCAAATMPKGMLDSCLDTPQQIVATSVSSKPTLFVETTLTSPSSSAAQLHSNGEGIAGGSLRVKSLLRPSLRLNVVIHSNLTLETLMSQSNWYDRRSSTDASSEDVVPPELVVVRVQLSGPTAASNVKGGEEPLTVRTRSLAERYFEALRRVVLYFEHKTTSELSESIKKYVIACSTLQGDALYAILVMDSLVYGFVHAPNATTEMITPVSHAPSSSPLPQQSVVSIQRQPSSPQLTLPSSSSPAVPRGTSESSTLQQPTSTTVTSVPPHLDKKVSHRAPKAVVLLSIGILETTFSFAFSDLPPPQGDWRQYERTTAAAPSSSASLSRESSTLQSGAGGFASAAASSTRRASIPFDLFFCLSDYFFWIDNNTSADPNDHRSSQRQDRASALRASSTSALFVECSSADFSDESDAAVVFVRSHTESQPANVLLDACGGTVSSHMRRTTMDTRSAVMLQFPVAVCNVPSASMVLGGGTSHMATTCEIMEARLCIVDSHRDAWLQRCRSALVSQFPIQVTSSGMPQVVLMFQVTPEPRLSSKECCCVAALQKGDLVRLERSLGDSSRVIFSTGTSSKFLRPQQHNELNLQLEPSSSSTFGPFVQENDEPSIAAAVYLGSGGWKQAAFPDQNATQDEVDVAWWLHGEVVGVLRLRLRWIVG